MPPKYEKSFRVLHNECDPWDRMTPGALLRRIQEISTAQCEAMGINEDTYRQTRSVFLLSRLSLRVTSMPVLGRQVRMSTHPYGVQRAVFFRLTSLQDAETGAPLCEADTRWVLVDTDTRRILRSFPAVFQPFTAPLAGETPHDMDLPKPGPLAQRATLEASYTLCDRNGHINNTKYADIVCDHLPLERLKQGAVKTMLLYYRSEIALGSRFALLEAEPGKLGYYFEAEQDGQRNFECFVTF